MGDQGFVKDSNTLTHTLPELSLSLLERYLKKKYFPLQVSCCWSNKYIMTVSPLVYDPPAWFILFSISDRLDLPIQEEKSEKPEQ